MLFMAIDQGPSPILTPSAARRRASRRRASRRALISAFEGTSRTAAIPRALRATSARRLRHTAAHSLLVARAFPSFSDNSVFQVSKSYNAAEVDTVYRQVCVANDPGQGCRVTAPLVQGPDAERI